MIDDPAQGFSLVPVDIRTQLDDFASGGHPKRLALASGAHRRGHLADAVTRCVAVVHRDAKPLVLHHDTGNRPELSRSWAAACSSTGIAAAAASF